MMSSIKASLLLCAWSSKTLACPATSTVAATVITDSYDDLQLGGEELGDEPVLSMYNGLQHNDFDVVGRSNVTNTYGEILPASGHQFAWISSLPACQSHSITVGSFFTTFDSQSFYFAGNQQVGQGDIDLAMPCVIAVIGLYADGSQVPVYTAGSYVVSPIESEKSFHTADH
jgi:hypothetical protein